MRFLNASLLMLLFIAVGVLLLARFGKYSRGFSRKITRGKTSLLVRVYFCLLFVAMAAYAIIIGYYDLGSDISQETVENVGYGVYYNFQEIIEGGALDKTKGIIKEKDWNFEMQAERLAIESLAFHEIYVEFVPDLGSTIEVSTYKTKSTMAGTDITDKITPPTVEFVKNKLLKDTLLIAKEPNKIKGWGFINGFVDSQFMKNQGDRFGRFISDTIRIGQHVIYIRVPESIALDDPSGMLMIIGENK